MASLTNDTSTTPSWNISLPANGTSPHTPSPCRNLKFIPSFHITAVVTAFFIVTINLLVLFLICRNRKLRRTPVNYLLLSFSCNDIISGLSILLHVMPYYYLAVNGCMDLRKIFNQKYMVASHMLSYMLLLNAVGHLLLLSSERFISLYHALRYHSMVTNFRILIACILAWTIATAMILIQLLWIIPFVISSQSQRRQSEKMFRMHAYRYTLVVVIAFFFIPAGVLIIQYSWFFLLIRRLVQSAPGTKKTNRSLKERKALIIYCAMFLCFLFCCLPYMVMQLLIYIDNESIRGLPSQFFEGIFLLRYIVSIVNPLLYTLYKRDFRQAAKATLVVPLRRFFSTNFDANDARQRIYLSVRDSSYLDNSFCDGSSSEMVNSNDIDRSDRGNDKCKVLSSSSTSHL